MVDSARLGAVVDECTAGSSELVVEGDGCCEGAEAGEDSFSEAWEGAGAVAFEGEQVFAGPEDALDALADRREVRPVAGLVFAARTDERCVTARDTLGEVAAGVALVAQERFAAVASDAVKEPQADFAFVDLWRCQRQRPGGAVGGEDRVQPEPPEEAGVRAAVAVVRRVSELGAHDGLAAA